MTVSSINAIRSDAAKLVMATACILDKIHEFSIKLPHAEVGEVMLLSDDTDAAVAELLSYVDDFLDYYKSALQHGGRQQQRHRVVIARFVINVATYCQLFKSVLRFQNDPPDQWALANHLTLGELFPELDDGEWPPVTNSLKLINEEVGIQALRAFLPQFTLNIKTMVQLLCNEMGTPASLQNEQIRHPERIVGIPLQDFPDYLSAIRTTLDKIQDKWSPSPEEHIGIVDDIPCLDHKSAKSIETKFSNLGLKLPDLCKEGYIIRVLSWDNNWEYPQFQFDFELGTEIIHQIWPQIPPKLRDSWQLALFLRHSFEEFGSEQFQKLHLRTAVTHEDIIPKLISVLAERLANVNCWIDDWRPPKPDEEGRIIEVCTNQETPVHLCDFLADLNIDPLDDQKIYLYRGIQDELRGITPKHGWTHFAHIEDSDPDAASLDRDCWVKIQRNGQAGRFDVKNLDQPPIAMGTNYFVLGDPQGTWNERFNSKVALTLNDVLSCQLYKISVNDSQKMRFTSLETPAYEKLRTGRRPVTQDIAQRMLVEYKDRVGIVYPLDKSLQSVKALGVALFGPQSCHNHASLCCESSWDLVKPGMTQRSLTEESKTPGLRDGSGLVEALLDHQKKYPDYPVVLSLFPDGIANH